MPIHEPPTNEFFPNTDELRLPTEEVRIPSGEGGHRRSSLRSAALARAIRLHQEETSRTATPMRPSDHDLYRRLDDIERRGT